jgi:hypothetical protein
MDDKAIVVIFVGLSLVLPVAALSIRIALKPIVESIARLMELRGGQQVSDLLERRVTLLEQEVQVLRAENTRLQEERDFYNQLESPNRH